MTKISILTLLAIALAVPSVVLAQSTTTQPPDQANPGMAQPPDQNGQAAQPEATEPAQTQSSPTAGTSGANSQSGQTMTGTTMSGTISPDGKTFNSSNGTFNISNASSAKVYANRPVTIEYETEGNNTIHISKLMLQRPQQ